MAHRHEDGTEHEHGGRQEYHIGGQHIIVDPDNQPHTHGTIKMRGAAQENDQAIPDDKPRTAEDAWVEERLRIERP